MKEHSNKLTEDSLLINRILSGNKYASSQLMDKHKDAVHAFLLKLTSNTTDAEDLTLETFEKVFKHLPKYSTSFAFSTWLYKIAKNTFLDFNRRKKAEVTRLENDTTNKIDSDDLNPEEYIISTQEISKLKSIINRLDVKYRKIAELRYIEGYSYKDIAESLNIPVNTVKIRLSRSKQLIQEITNNKTKSKWIK